MIKLTAALLPKEGWTVEEWLTHYRERHAALTAATRNFNRHAVRYLQNSALHSPQIPAFPELDNARVAVTELWFESLSKIAEAYNEPDYFTYLRTDELRFNTFEGIVAGVAEEHEVFSQWVHADDDRSYLLRPRVKIFAFRTRRDGIERDVMQQHWAGDRVGAFADFAPYREYVRRYVQTRMLDADIGLPGGVSHDLIDEFYFDSVAEAIAFWSALRSDAGQRAADAAHSAPDKLWIMFATEHEVFGPLPPA